MLKIYVSCPMTGKTGAELVHQSLELHRIAAAVSRRYDCKIELLDPVKAEEVKVTTSKLFNPQDILNIYWKRDKEMIREAHVLIDLSAAHKSEGCLHEFGYSRYYLWKPSFRVYDGLGASIARIESDYVAPDFESALVEAVKLFGNPLKRWIWRVRIVWKAIPKLIFWQVRFLIYP